MPSSSPSRLVLRNLPVPPRLAPCSFPIAPPFPRRANAAFPGKRASAGGGKCCKPGTGRCRGTATVVSFYWCLSVGNQRKTSADIIKTKCQVAQYEKIGVLSCWKIFSVPCRLCAVLLISIKTVMTIIPEKSAACCRWARKRGESLYVINCSSCFRNTTSNFSGFVDRNSPLIKAALPLLPLYPQLCICVVEVGGGSVACLF